MVGTELPTLHYVYTRNYCGMPPFILWAAHAASVAADRTSTTDKPAYLLVGGPPPTLIIVPHPPHQPHTTHAEISRHFYFDPHHPCTPVKVNTEHQTSTQNRHINLQSIINSFTFRFQQYQIKHIERHKEDFILISAPKAKDLGFATA